MIEQKSVSIKDVARKLNISLSTVNRALTGKPGVSEERRLEVQRAAQEMGYVVNNIAQILSRKPMTVGVIIPSTWGEYYSDIKIGMEAEFEKLSAYKASSAFYYIGSEPSSEETDNLKSWSQKNQLDAVIYCPVNALNDLVLQVIRNLDIPMFLAGGGIEPVDFITTVSVDAKLSGKIAADFFICIYGADVRSAVFAIDDSGNRKKLQAFRKRIEEKGGKVISAIISGADLEESSRLMSALYKVHPEINCVYVCSGNSITICEYIAEHELKDKITLLGTDRFDRLDSYIRQGVMKATIFQNQETLGRIVVRRVYEYLVKTRSYGNEEWQPEKQIFIRPELHLMANVE